MYADNDVLDVTPKNIVIAPGHRRYDVIARAINLIGGLVRSKSTGGIERAFHQASKFIRAGEMPKHSRKWKLEAEAQDHG